MPREIDDVFDIFLHLQAEAEMKGLALTFTGEEFLLRKTNNQLWAKCGDLSEVGSSIETYAWMTQYGSLL